MTRIKIHCNQAAQFTLLFFYEIMLNNRVDYSLSFLKASNVSFQKKFHDFSNKNVIMSKTFVHTYLKNICRHDGKLVEDKIVK